MNFNFILIALISILSIGCKQFSSFNSTPLVKIPTGSGPEDLAYFSEDGKFYLIAACADRRSKNSDSDFYLINAETLTSSKMQLVNLPDSLHLDLHGIDIETIGGTTYLYAIDHHQIKKWHQLIRFKIKNSQLVFDTIFASPKFLINPNDLDVDSDGNIYVTNSLGRGSVFWQYLLNLKRSSVVKYNAAEKKWELLLSKMAYANGVVISDSALFIATTRMNGLYSYPIHNFKNGITLKGNSGRRIAIIKGLDNLTTADGVLYTTAHPDFIKFIKHAKSSTKISPSQIWSINPKNNQKSLIYQSDGSEISGASTALFFNGRLFIGQIFEPFVGEIKLK